MPLFDPTLHPLDIFLQVWGLLIVFLVISIFLDRGQLLDVELIPYYEPEEESDYE